MSGFEKINNSLDAAFVLLYDLKSILILIDTTDGSLLAFDLMRQASKVGGPDFELTPYKIEVEW